MVSDIYIEHQLTTLDINLGLGIMLYILLISLLCWLLKVTTLYINYSGIVLGELPQFVTMAGKILGAQ